MFKKLIPHLLNELLKKIFQLWKTPGFGLVWFFLLFFISFLVMFQFFFIVIFIFIYFLTLIFKYIFSFFEKNSEKIILYKYSNFNISNNYILFLKFIFIDLSKKWSFFYFYQFLYLTKFFFSVKNKKNIFSKNFNIKVFTLQIFNILKNCIIKYFIYLLTTFTYMVLNLSLEITIKFQHLWYLNWSNYLIFFDNLMLDIVSTYNENIEQLIFNKKIIIKKGSVVLNPKDKLILLTKDSISRSLSNFNDVWKYSLNLAKIPYVDIKEPHVLVSSTANLSRVMTKYSGSIADGKEQIYMGLKYGNKKTIVSTFIDNTKFKLNEKDCNISFTYSGELYKNNLKSMDFKNRFFYKFNNIVNPDKNQNILLPCIEIDNKDIKLSNINDGLKNALFPQNENNTPERLMFAKNFVLNFNEPLYKIIIKKDHNSFNYFIFTDDENDTIKNRFINNKKEFSIILEPIFEDLNDFVEVNPVLFKDKEVYRVYKHAFNFYIVQETRTGSFINMLDLAIKSDSDGSNF